MESHRADHPDCSDTSEQQQLKKWPLLWQKSSKDDTRGSEQPVELSSTADPAALRSNNHRSEFHARQPSLRFQARETKTVTQLPRGSLGDTNRHGFQLHDRQCPVRGQWITAPLHQDCIDIQPSRFLTSAKSDQTSAQFARASTVFFRSFGPASRLRWSIVRHVVTTLPPAIFAGWAGRLRRQQ